MSTSPHVSDPAANPASDHTAIPIAFDPVQERMRGVTVHGNVHFDVPFISPVTDTLWQGGCRSGLLLPFEVRHVLSLYPWEAYTRHDDVLSFREVRLYDDLNGPDRDQMIELAEYVRTCQETGITLVHCQAGLNRSGLVAGLSLVLAGMAPREALDLLRAQRSPAVLCNPVFERWLLEFKI